MVDPPSPPPPEPTCTVCRGTGVCSFCSGEGYVAEHERLNPCGVCETTGVCTVCCGGD